MIDLSVIPGLLEAIEAMRGSPEPDEAPTMEKVYSREKPRLDAQASEYQHSAERREDVLSSIHLCQLARSLDMSVAASIREGAASIGAAHEFIARAVLIGFTECHTPTSSGNGNGHKWGEVNAIVDLRASGGRVTRFRGEPIAVSVAVCQAMAVLTRAHTPRPLLDEPLVVTSRDLHRYFVPLDACDHVWAHQRRQEDLKRVQA